MVFGVPPLLGVLFAQESGLILLAGAALPAVLISITAGWCLKDRTYYAYAIYFIAVLGTFAWGRLIDEIWGFDTGGALGGIVNLGNLAYAFAFSCFVTGYFRTAQTMPGWHRFFQLSRAAFLIPAVWVGCDVFLRGDMNLPSSWGVLVVNFVTLIASLLISLHAVRLRVPWAKTFLISNVPLTISGSLLAVQFVVDSNGRAISDLFPFWLGVLANMNCFLIAMVYRYRSLQQLAEHEAIEHARVEAQVEARQASLEAKSEMLATVSHEIRTPMSGMQGYARLLSMTSLTPDQREAVDMISSNANQLMDMVDDLLDLSKLEAGRMEVLAEAVPVAAVADEVCRLFLPRAREKHLSLIARIDPELPDLLETDPGKFRQILINLVGNAVKFTRNGEVVCFARYDRTAGVLTCEVSDTGPGISPEQQRNLFQRYQQANAEVAREFGGTGLGLAISHQLAQLLGGDLTIASELGQGTTLSLTLPCRVVN